jgi:hypothetical protein
MKVFISWSGRRSREVADALAGWLKKVIQSAEPWVSSDMERGVKWLAEISKSLDVHSVGIMCVTPGNVSAPWLNFEAGALSKQIDDQVRVIPYLLDFRSASELQPPLGQFNAALTDEEGTFDLVKTLNAHAEPRLSDADLAETFKMWWPGLNEKLESIKNSGTGQPPERRSTDDKINELVDLARQQAARQPVLFSNYPEGAPVVVNVDPWTNPVVGLSAPGTIRAAGGPISDTWVRNAAASRNNELKRSATEVVDLTTAQAGLDRAAMSVMEASDDGIRIHLPTVIDQSVMDGVRNALKMSLTGDKNAKLPVSFYTTDVAGKLTLFDDER